VLDGGHNDKSVGLQDGGHYVKSISSLVSRAVRKIRSENRLVLTGTPLHNNLAELAAILSFLAPDIFTEAGFAYFQGFDCEEDSIVDKADKVKEAQKLLSAFMLRRTTEQVEKMLPKKIETMVREIQQLAIYIVMLLCIQ